MFYTFRQNNSGGNFVFDEKVGLGVYVIIEAPTEKAATRIAEDIGLYFNGVDDGIDCSCCGDRWYSPESGTEGPEYAGLPIENHEVVQSYGGWNRKGGAEGYIHYRNGTVAPLQVKRVTYEEEKAMYKERDRQRELNG